MVVRDQPTSRELLNAALPVVREAGDFSVTGSKAVSLLPFLPKLGWADSTLYNQERPSQSLAKSRTISVGPQVHFTFLP